MNMYLPYIRTSSYISNIFLFITCNSATIVRKVGWLLQVLSTGISYLVLANFDQLRTGRNVENGQVSSCIPVM